MITGDRRKSWPPDAGHGLCDATMRPHRGYGAVPKLAALGSVGSGQVPLDGTVILALRIGREPAQAHIFKHALARRADGPFAYCFEDRVDTMATKAVTHGPRACAVEISPSEVDAGTELILTCHVWCSHGCDLTGQSVSIQNQDATELASAELAEFDGKTHITSALVLRAPLKAGVHVYRAVLATHEKDGVLHEGTSSEFSFIATAHAASVNVWGLPSAIAAGEHFRFKVGIKCSAGCKLTGRQLSIFDHEGAQVGAASLLDDVWAGTSALYFAEVEAQAPFVTGDYQWQVATPASDMSVPHAAGSCTFAVKVVSPSDHEVTVEAFDSEKQTPIKGAHVLLHPYRALTNEAGVAKLEVTKGTYKLFVSGFNYIAYENIIDVGGHVTVRAELIMEPEGQEDYR